MASDSESDSGEVAATTPVLQVGPTLTALESSENAVFSTELPTTVTREEARVALGRLAHRGKSDLHHLHPQPSPSLPAQGSIADRAWGVVERALAGRYAWFDAANEPWAVRCKNNLTAIRAIVEAGRCTVWLAIEAEMEGQQTRVEELEGEAWWQANNTTKHDSRAGITCTFPRSQAAGIYIIQGFLAGACVLNYDGRSIFLYGRLVSHISEAYKPEGKNLLLYQIIRRIIDKGGYFTCAPAIITGEGDSLSQLQHDATAVAELYVAVVLGSCQVNKGFLKARADAGIPVIKVDGANVKIPFEAPYRGPREIEDGNADDDADDEGDLMEAKPATTVGPYLQNIVARTMLYELWQLFGRLSTILALQQYPEEAPSAVTTSAEELQQRREAVEEEIDVMKLQVTDEYSRLLHGDNDDEYKTCARTCADGRTYSTVAGVHVAGRFLRKIGVKHGDVYTVKLEYGAPDSSKDLFVSLTPFEAVLFAGIRVRLRAPVKPKPKPDPTASPAASASPSPSPNASPSPSPNASPSPSAVAFVETYWQETKHPLRQKYHKLGNALLQMMLKAYKVPRLKQAARMVYEAEQQALHFTLNVSTLAQQAQTAGGILIIKGGVKMKLPNGDEVEISGGKGDALQAQREALYAATGHGSHWHEGFEGEVKLAWPTLLAYIDVTASDGSFRPAVTTHLAAYGRPPPVAEQCAELRVLTAPAHPGGVQAIRFPFYISRQAGMQPLWDVITELHQATPGVRQPVAPLQPGEHELFEAVWRGFTKHRRVAWKNRPPKATNRDVVVSKEVTEELFPGWSAEDGIERYVWIKLCGHGVRNYSEFRIRISKDMVTWYDVGTAASLKKAWAHLKQCRAADGARWGDNIGADELNDDA